MAPRTALAFEEIVRAAGAGAAGATDRELLRRFAEAGDQAAFAALFRRHCGLVLGVCRRALSNVQDAEDACQATFLILARKAASSHWQPSLANWLHATARRAAGNARVAAERRARRERRASTPATVQPVDRMTGRELLDVLDEELDRLPPRYREPLVLCYLEGLARDEAAARLGVPLTTVKSRLERGRKQLGDALTKRGCVLGAGLLALAATSPAGASPLRLAESVLAAVAGKPSAAVARLAERGAVKSLANKSIAALLLLAGTAALGFGLVGAQQPVARQSPPVDKTPAADPAGARLVSGRVVGPDGKPLAGVKLFSAVWKSFGFERSQDYESPAIGTSEADGSFSVSVPAFGTKNPQWYVIAYAPGFGSDWLTLGGPDDPAWSAEKTLRLPKDVPIKGRLVNTEGHPVPGVSVSVRIVDVPKDDNLDAFLAARNRDAIEAGNPWRKGISVLPDAVAGPVTTDRDGRFTLRGAGAERRVFVQLSGGGVARMIPQVITRPGFDPKQYNDALRRQTRSTRGTTSDFFASSQLHAPEFEFVVESGKQIAGVVSDAVTGEPVAGCSVIGNGGLWYGVQSLSDDRGRFRLAGLRKEKDGYTVTVDPPRESAYLGQSHKVADTAGFTPTRLDVRMARGAVVTGRVIDRQTGKGVPAGIRFAPLPDNKLFGTRPEYTSYPADREERATDEDGRFRLVTLPGPSLVLARVWAGEKDNGGHDNPYRRATPDPDHKDRFQRIRDSWSVVAAGSTPEFIGQAHAVKVLDVQGTGETAVELFVERGVTGKIVLQDDSGQPLTEVWVSGISDFDEMPYSLKKATATLYALDPAKPRQLILYHPERRLGGTVTVGGDEKEPVVARLGPLGRLTGRLLDADGQPLAGVTVWLYLNGQSDRIRWWNSLPRKRVQADSGKDGRFAVDGLIPGMAYNSGPHKGTQYYQWKSRFLPCKVMAGETLDLGDRTLEPSP
jgi:RNA polymerase sigma factor (sigma-70 family)